MENKSISNSNEEVKEVVAAGEPAFVGTVLEGKERRYTIINERDVRKYLSQKDRLALQAVLSYYLGKIEEGREKDGKNPFNSYIVINTDEPYIPEIVEVMKRHGHFEEMETQIAHLTFRKIDDNSIAIYNSNGELYTTFEAPAKTKEELISSANDYYVHRY